jgi:hypothetical protein
VQNICEEKMTSMIEQACLAAWPDYEAVTDEMRSRMRAAIAAMQEPTDGEHTVSTMQALMAQGAVIVELQDEIATLKAERDGLRKEIARLHEEWKAWKTIFDHGVVVLKDELGELRAELKVWNSSDEMIPKLRAALEFYGNAQNWLMNDSGHIPAITDGGIEAHRALEETK